MLDDDRNLRKAAMRLLDKGPQALLTTLAGVLIAQYVIAATFIFQVAYGR